ncbi:uncharacterized protein LOC128230117 isoform X1 [Mya arenaria]|uniref:uncharacterized protein LOC128230117 isoform X1 n=2 Tax=Mya arenaria TaxID=6604 RepID=UPI0022E22961|nr:uncharacterized protein LOC128230117 isoform X1 [Mya arenaria]
MGKYSQSGTLASRPSSINIRRQSLDRRPSLDMLSDDGLKDLSHGLNLGRDSVIDPIDLSAILHKKKKEGQPFYRCRKRLNIWLHTHIALIVVCILSSLDAVCVIGQVICDILIMSDKLADYDKLHTKATGLLVEVIPKFFSDNSTDYLSWSFEKVVEHIETMHSGGTHLIEDHGSHDTGHVEHGGFSIFKRSNVGTPRASADDDHAEHDLLHELTHSFHIGSMVILSVLLAEAFLKIFAMGKHFLHHKLEIFDAFVIMVSWSLDVAFWEGIWARPGQEGATLLIFILPWRVIRIVNSFVLVIQEKDLVLLKVVKQRLRLALRREKDSAVKLDKYRLEVRQLQGLCRKHGAEESAIQACCPTGRRRRSSLFQSLTSLASVALVSAMGALPRPEAEQVSSSESEDELKLSPTSLPRTDSTASMDVFSITPEEAEMEIRVEQTNKAFTFDEPEMIKHIPNGTSTKL